MNEEISMNNATSGFIAAAQNAPTGATPLPPTDPGNQHIIPCGSSLTVHNAKLSGPGVTDGGDRVVATLRVGPATVTVFLSRTEAEQWSSLLAQSARHCSPLVVPN